MNKIDEYYTKFKDLIVKAQSDGIEISVYNVIQGDELFDSGIFLKEGKIFRTENFRKISLRKRGD